MTELEVNKEPLYTRLEPKILRAFEVKIAHEMGLKKGNKEVALTIAIKLFVAADLDKFKEPIEHNCKHCGHTTYYTIDVLYATCPECGKVDKI